MSMYVSSLQAMEYLLDRVDEKRWRDWIRTDIEWWNERKNVNHHLQAYGGMGSFNDLVICKMNHHKINKALEPWIDVLFNWLKSICFTLARFPEQIFTVDELKKKIGYYDAPLSAFVGGKTATIEQRQLINHRNNIQGWCCLKCGCSQIDEYGISYYLAQTILPILLFEACVKDELISVINKTFDQDLPNIQSLKLEIKVAMNKCCIRFVNETMNWMRPCPACSSDDTAVYRWFMQNNCLIPENNNLSVKKKRWWQW